MKVVDCAQGTEEWCAARRGMPTASQFHRIVTPKTLKYSAQAHAYLCELIAERISEDYYDQDRRAAIEASEWIARGQDLEAAAVSGYELLTDRETTKVGFCTTDDGRLGCSPDRIVGDDGGLELKCPAASTHIGYVLAPESHPYHMQIQGSLYVTGRKWWDFMSFHPDFEQVLTRYEPDAAIQDALAEHLTTFLARLDEAMKRFA